MNILFLTASPITEICGGGIERSTERCAREMLARGHKVRILSWGAKEEMSADVPQNVFPKKNPRDDAENRKFFARALREEKIDVVVFQCGAGWRFPFPKEIRESGVPAICVIRSVPDSYVARYRQKYSGIVRWWNTWSKRRRQERKYRFNYDCCARTVVLVRGLVPILERHLTKEQVARGKIDVVWNFAPSRKENVDFSAKKKELLFVGRMSFVEKRPDLLLRAWTKLQTAFPDWSLRFVGKGEYLPELKKLAETLGAERVSFEGFQKPEKYYRDAAIFCMTSAYESFGNVLVEAAAFGCVPVAFDSFPAARDIIADGENGALVPAFDLDAYAETLARLMRDDALREQLARNALAQIPEKFSPEKIGGAWEKLFAEVLSEKKRSERIRESFDERSCLTNKKKKNVLFLLDSMLPTVCRGGIERTTEVLARELTRRGNGVQILVWRGEPDASVEFPQSVFPQRKPRNTTENRELFVRTLREEKIDVVVFQCGAGWRFPFPSEARACGVPVVSVIHTVPDSFKARYRVKYSGVARWWNTLTKRWRQARKYRFNYDCCARTVVLAESLEPTLEKFLTRSQIAEGRIAAIANAATYACVPEAELSRKKKELLFVGRMSFVEKRPDLLLRAWTKLQTAFPEWSLRFVGDGENLSELKRLAGKLGAERVRFEGFCDPAPFYRDAAIFCMTSAYEGFGMVLVEAAAFGCVPVAFESYAAARDIISDGENGALVPAFDVDAYAETLARFMRDDALRERLARNALAQIPSKFSPQKIGDAWETLFEKIEKENR
ncbi:MAG: glycosyltransferase [Candidatus Spyradosoma sp.]